nr:MAG TPA: hypothetical protein [Caudoviricetes sp.]
MPTEVCSVELVVLTLPPNGWDGIMPSIAR